VLVTPDVFHPIFGVFALDQFTDVGLNLSTYLKLSGREIIFEVFKPTVCDHGTSTAQTDMQTTYCHMTVLCVAPPGKNSSISSKS